jgi:hypothetical protein
LRFPKIGTPVKVTWLDSTSLPGWHYFHEGQLVDSRPRRQISRGLLVGVGTVAITLAHTVGPRSLLDSTEGLLDLLIVPKGAITALQVIQ